MEGTDAGLWFTLGIRVVAFVFYADHLRRVVAQYNEQRTPRNLRSLVLSAVLALGTLAMSLGPVATLDPALRDAIRVFGGMVAGAVFVAAVFIFLSHRIQGDER